MQSPKTTTIILTIALLLAGCSFDDNFLEKEKVQNKIVNEIENEEIDNQELENLKKENSQPKKLKTFENDLFSFQYRDEITITNVSKQSELSRYPIWTGSDRRFNFNDIYFTVLYAKENSLLYHIYFDDKSGNQWMIGLKDITDCPDDIEEIVKTVKFTGVEFIEDEKGWIIYKNKNANIEIYYNPDNVKISSTYIPDLPEENITYQHYPDSGQKTLYRERDKIASMKIDEDFDGFEHQGYRDKSITTSYDKIKKYGYSKGVLRQLPKNKVPL
jgi:hypothetical protein